MDHIQQQSNAQKDRLGYSDASQLSGRLRLGKIAPEDLEYPTGVGIGVDTFDEGARDHDFWVGPDVDLENEVRIAHQWEQ